MRTIFKDIPSQNPRAGRNYHNHSYPYNTSSISSCLQNARPFLNLLCAPLFGANTLFG
ncbi:hypothetical protein BYT27DRAFT_7190256 [Phlegmacium glaucopus]|nr:hypothetical protein BYT27DRAFT_7190256 [Phlegmacium glaucopus]